MFVFCSITSLALRHHILECRTLRDKPFTEILNTRGVDTCGTLPDPHGLATTYTAAVATGASAPDAARTLIALLTAPENAAARMAAGFS